MSQQEQPRETQTVESTYRVIGFGGEGRTILLYDIGVDDPVWVPTEGYSGELRETVAGLQPGNVLEATLVGHPDAESMWRFDQARVVARQRLDLAIGVDRVPAPTEDAWDNRPEDREVGISVLRDDETNRVEMELQVHPETHEGMDVFQQMREGKFPLEPWYDGLSSVPEGAEEIIVVNPTRQPYIAICAFPEQSTITDEFRSRLYNIAEKQS